MTARLQLTGRAFGRLTVLRLDVADRYTHWLCRCACGNTTVALGKRLTNGDTRSCGCLLRDHYARTLPVKAKTALAWRELADAMRRVPAVKVP